MARHCGRCGEAGHYASTCKGSTYASVKRGLEQSANGETVSLGSFAKYAEDAAPEYIPGLWLVNPDNNKIAGKILRTNKTHVTYMSMLGAETESALRDVANANYMPVDLEPAHLLKFAMFYK